jgi:hypothetical protein
MPSCRRLWLACLLFLPAALLGCSDGPKIVRVSGTVTRAGKPVPHLHLNFLPETGRPSWALTDENGHYTVHYDREHEGAVVGTHKVWVQFRAASPSEEAALYGGKAKRPPDQAAILEKYGKEATTPLKYDINKNNQVIDIELD